MNPSSKFPKNLQPNFLWKGDGENITDLPVHLDFEQGRSISSWELSPEELEEVKKTGVIYLHVYGQHPPVYVGTALDFEGDKGEEG